MRRSIEVMANLTVMTCGIWAISMFIQYRHAAVNNSQGTLVPGREILIQGVNFKNSQKTLVIALQQGCQFCAASMEFYKRLTEQAKQNRNARIIAVFPNKVSEAKLYLQERGLGVSDIRQVSLSALNVSGTPTLILVNREGIAERIWVGQLAGSEESQVVTALL